MGALMRTGSKKVVCNVTNDWDKWNQEHPYEKKGGGSSAPDSNDVTQKLANEVAAYQAKKKGGNASAPTHGLTPEQHLEHAGRHDDAADRLEEKHGKPTIRSKQHRVDADTHRAAAKAGGTKKLMDHGHGAIGKAAHIAKHAGKFVAEEGGKAVSGEWVAKAVTGVVGAGAATLLGRKSKKSEADAGE